MVCQEKEPMRNGGMAVIVGNIKTENQGKDSLRIGTVMKSYETVFSLSVFP